MDWDHHTLSPYTLDYGIEVSREKLDPNILDLLGA